MQLLLRSYGFHLEHFFSVSYAGSYDLGHQLFSSPLPTDLFATIS